MSKIQFYSMAIYLFWFGSPSGYYWHVAKREASAVLTGQKSWESAFYNHKQYRRFGQF